MRDETTKPRDAVAHPQLESPACCLTHVLLICGHLGGKQQLALDCPTFTCSSSAAPILRQACVFRSYKCPRLPQEAHAVKIRGKENQRGLSLSCGL